MRPWFIVIAYLVVVLAVTGVMGWLFLTNRMPTWLPVAAFGVLVPAGLIMAWRLT